MYTVWIILHFRIDLAHDVFGRERHRLHKDDMGGVGTFDKECRTLYVGGLAHRTKLEKLLWIEFGEWGEIEVHGIFNFVCKAISFLRGKVAKLYVLYGSLLVR